MGGIHPPYPPVSTPMGSYKIVEVHEPVNVSIMKNNKIVQVHINHLQLFKETSD